MTAFPSSQLDMILQAGHSSVHLFFIAVAALLGIALVLHDARKWTMGMRHRIGLLVVVFGGGLMGAALPDAVAGNVMQLRAQQCAISPKTIIGGLLFGFVGAVVYKRLLNLKEPTSDAFARGTCLMMAIGRLGCYAQHCCFGIPTHAFWGQDFGDGIARHPTQLIESAALWIAFVILRQWHRKNRFPDRRLFIFFVFYGLLRFALEFLREPLADSIGPLGYYQWFCLLLAGTGLYQIVRRTGQGLQESMA